MYCFVTVVNGNAVCNIAKSAAKSQFDILLNFF